MCRLRLVLFILAVLCLIPSLARSWEPYGSPFSLAVGDTTAVGDEGLILGFTEVLSDSRCPVGVWCFWPGDVEAALRVSVPGCGCTGVVLHTYYDFEQSADLGIAVVHLVAVEPYPVVDLPPIEPSEYVATLVVFDSGPTDTRPRSWGAVKALYR